MNRLLLRWCVLASANLVAASVGAQSPTRALPEALVNALFGNPDRMGPAGSPQYFVGVLPTGYPTTLVPAGPVTVVGGSRSAGEVVVVLADSTRRLAAVLEQLFEAEGYARPATEAASGFSSAGGPYRFFCKDSSMVSVVPLIGEVREMARVTYSVHRGRSCSNFGPPPSLAKALKLPPLKPYPKANVSSAGGGGGDREVDSRAFVTGRALDPSAILAHYVAQLAQAGWKAGEPAISASVGAQFLEATDDAGNPWEGTIMVSGSKTAMNLALVMRAH